jgi:hypothetical protein
VAHLLTWPTRVRGTLHVVHAMGPDVGKHVGLELVYFSYWKNCFLIVALINQADFSGCRYIRILMCSVSL